MDCEGIVSSVDDILEFYKRQTVTTCIGVGSTGAPGAGAPLVFFSLPREECPQTTIGGTVLCTVLEPPCTKISSYAYDGGQGHLSILKVIKLVPILGVK